MRNGVDFKSPRIIGWRFNFVLFQFVLVHALASIGVCTLRAEEMPNIVVILVDDLGYGELGCQGNPQIPTPNIDSIAENGIRFTQGYVTAPYCSASRAGLFTGRNQNRFGYVNNPIGAMNDEPGVGLPLDEKTLADYLKDKGYTTGLYGKWHLGASSRYLPLRRGFDDFFGFLHEGHYYVPSPYYNHVTWLRRKALPGGGKGVFTSQDKRMIYSTHMGSNEPIYDASNPIYRNGQPVEEKDNLTDAITREATEFILRNFDKPFFLCLSYNAVHSPMQGADRYVHKFRKIKDVQRRIFAAMLSNLDESVGDVMGAIQRTNRSDNTLVFFLSDNGGPTRELTSSNRPLRGEKGSLYDGGVRVPFMMQWQKKIPRGRVFKQPVSSLDIFATVKDVVGFESLQQGKIDGVNLLPFIAGAKTGRPHEKLFWRTKRQVAMRSGDWKIIQDSKTGEIEIYDLAADIGEKNNLAQSDQEKRKELSAQLLDLSSTMNLKEIE